LRHAVVLIGNNQSGFTVLLNAWHIVSKRSANLLSAVERRAVSVLEQKIYKNTQVGIMICELQY